MIHGLGGNRQTVFPQAVMFLEKGYNVLAYDQRSAGENTAPYTTFGYLESADAADCVAYLDGMLDRDKAIYLWGVSNGAATAGISVRHAIVPQRASAIVLDCPISSTQDMIRLTMEDMDIGLPLGFLSACGSLYNRVALGFFYGDASSAAQLSKVDLPVLIIASKADAVTPYWMAQKIHAQAGRAALVSVEDSAHAEIYTDAPAWYENEVFAFIDAVKAAGA